MSEALCAVPDLEVRRHQNGNTCSKAVFSSCGHYRYSLSRVWLPAADKIIFIMLNPSTACERKNDPTVERCERRARRLEFGGFMVCNIFAFRATRPEMLREVDDVVGPDNDRAIIDGCDWADKIVCAWGDHGELLGRGREVGTALRNRGHTLYRLGSSVTAKGHPRHPLYRPYSERLEKW